MKKTGREESGLQKQDREEPGRENPDLRDADRQKEIDSNMYLSGLILLILAAGLMVLTRCRGTESGMPFAHCLFHEVTGYYCPGCGGTRAVKALLEGRFLQSLYYHPAVLYMAVPGGLFMGSQTLQKISGGRWKTGIHFHLGWVWGLAAVVLLNWILKNSFLFLAGIALI